MVRHWLQTPPDGYLGSPYGADVKALLQRPQGDRVALNDFLNKMRTDLPVLSFLPSDAVRVWVEPTGPDKQEVRIDIAGTLIKSGGAK